MSTGLVRVEPAGTLGKGLTAWINSQQADHDLPPMRHKSSYHVTMNGCPLSLGAHRTFCLGAGDYFLHTMSASKLHKCDNFNVKMECSGGGETASPAGALHKCRLKCLEFDNSFGETLPPSSRLILSYPPPHPDLLDRTVDC